jgi:transcription elongation factor GreB
VADPNYITPTGIKKLQDELRQLIQVERPELVKTVAWAASNGDRSENADYIYGKRRLREIDKRSYFLTKRIESAQVVDPATLKGGKVIFGATVTFENEDGEAQSLMIVGEDESAPEQGRVSWKSPIARALLGKSVGNDVKLAKPSGDAFVEIKAITFKPYL